MYDLNIYQRINAVMKEVEYIKKDATITGGGTYQAVTHDNVTAVLRPYLVANGIVVRVEQLQSSVLQMRDKPAGIAMLLYSGDYAVHFVNIDNPEDFMTVFFNAHANDTGDKAPGKCASYAVKMAQLKTFSLETGESDEGRYHEAPLFTDHQKARFDELLDDDNAMGYACFSQEIGEEAMKELCGTFPDGRKSQGKALCKKLEQEGWVQLKDYASQISELIGNKDPAVLELTGELLPMEKRLVAGMLTDIEVAHLKKMKELAA